MMMWLGDLLHPRAHRGVVFQTETWVEMAVIDHICDVRSGKMTVMGFASEWIG
jgi:hypothetical protein